MRIYKAVIYDEGEGKLLSWYANKAGAQRGIKRTLSENYAKETAKLLTTEIIAQDVEMTMTGLLNWLNGESFARTDNG